MKMTLSTSPTRAGNLSTLKTNYPSRMNETINNDDIRNYRSHTVLKNKSSRNMTVSHFQMPSLTSQKIIPTSKNDYSDD